MRAGFDRPEHRLIRIGHRERLAVDIPHDLRNMRLDHRLEGETIERWRSLGIAPQMTVVFRRRDRETHGPWGGALVSIR